MADAIDLRDLDAPPDAETVTALREEASTREATVGVTFPAGDGDSKRFVVSPRGTCVLLNDTREDSFTPSVGADEIAAALRG